MDLAAIEVAPEEWDDLVTKYEPDHPIIKQNNFTDGTKNIDTDNTGNIVKRKGIVDYSTLPASAKDQFEAIFSDGVHHLLTVEAGNLRYSSGDGVENLVTAGYSSIVNFEFATIRDRVYFGNTITAQVYDRTASYGGVSYTVPKTKIMGAQAPTVAPTAGAPTAGGNVPNGAHTYKITFVYYGSEESNGGPASGVQTAGAGNNTIPLTAIQVGGYGVTSRKIYRDNNDGVWVHLATLSDNTTTVYTDTLAVGATPTPIPTDNGVPPAFGLITAWLDRAWISKISGEPYTLYYSEAGLPDIFPANNRLICNQQDPISMHIVYRGRLVVWNRNSMGYIEGTTPDTFRYVDVQGSVGCVDNRTLQIRVIDGVPIVVWLSDKGFYAYNGSSIDYVSDPIEDLVNFNIQQAVLQRGRNSQTTQSDFTNGTPSNGINLLTFPGFITTRAYESGSSTVGANPRRTWDDQTDWEGGSVKSNVVTRDGTNLLKSPTKFEPTAASGTFAGQAFLSGGAIKLPQSTAWNGESTSTSSPTGSTNYGALAMSFVPPRSGNLTAVKLAANVDPGSPTTGRGYTFTIETDSGGQPSGTVLGTGTIISSAAAPLETSSAVSVALTGGVRYWMVFTKGSSNTAIMYILQGGTLTGGTTTLVRNRDGSNNPTGPYFAAPLTAACGYNFTYTKVPASGTWTSPINDTKCAFFDSAKTYSIAILNASFPFQPGTSIGFDVQGSNDPAFLSFIIVSSDGAGVTSNNHNLANFRYWRIKISLSITDDVFTPSTTGPRLLYTVHVTIVPQEWVSEAIDTTADVTAYNSLSMVSTTPAGTSVTMTIATSNDNLTYDPFVTFGSEVMRRYVKIKLTLVMNAAQDTTPSVTSVNFTWTIVANHVSSIIDTGATPPAGWDIFQAAIASAGAGITFQMRSATTSGGIPAATFFTIVNGDFPTAVTPLQFTQWKVTITSTDGNVASIDSVTVNWFIGNTTNIRPASIFTGGRYYVALAEFNQLTNNIILEIDLKGKWRLYRGLNIATFSLFFNQPYAGLSDIGRIVKFLQGSNDRGTNIEVDIRTPAHDFSTFKNNNIDRYKVVHKFFLIGKNTGATYQVSFSVDEGETFTTMLDDTGASTFTTATDGKGFYKRLQASHADGNLVSGRTVMYRVYSNDANDVHIAAYKAQAFVRKGEPVVTA